MLNVFAKSAEQHWQAITSCMHLGKVDLSIVSKWIFLFVYFPLIYYTYTPEKRFNHIIFAVSPFLSPPPLRGGYCLV